MSSRKPITTSMLNSPALRAEIARRFIAAPPAIQAKCRPALEMAFGNRIAPTDWHAGIRERLREPHPQQARFIDSPAKRKVIRAGRRSGKTVGVSMLAVEAFLRGKRVLYAVPTQEQVERFWFEVKRSLEPAIDAGTVYKNETRHVLELLGSETRIRAKTAWDADTLRGDYCDLLILDEWQMCNEDAWGVVGAPMMLDNNGDAVFIYTPPSFRSAGKIKAHDPRHAAKLFERAAADTTGRWETFHFSSAENPHLSQEALSEITQDMTSLAYRQEILAEDIDEVPGALWTRAKLDALRITTAPELHRIAVAVDPSVGTGDGDEAGIVVGGIGGPNAHGYLIADYSMHGSPDAWARQAVVAYHKHSANFIVAEKNQGGEMVRLTIHGVDPNVPVELVSATRGKYLRAEPVSVLYEHGRCHHVGAAEQFAKLELEMCQWTPDNSQSPNRLDALVWLWARLMVGTNNAQITPVSFGVAESRWAGMQ